MADVKHTEEAAAETTTPETPIRGVLDVANTGRAKCRACDKPIAKGSLRVGAVAKNPFAEGETTYWFHPDCAQRRLTATWLSALAAASPELLTALNASAADAERRAQHPRLNRISALEWAPSGRARCRHCREAIDKHTVRAALSIFHDGRFDPIGYAHLSCLNDYVGTPLLWEDISQLTTALPETARSAVEACLNPVELAGRTLTFATQ